MAKKYKDPNNEEAYTLGKIYVKKNTSYFYKVVFYTLNVAFGYYILKDLNFLPVYLGGSGEFSNMFVNGNMDSTFLQPAYFKIYYMMYLSHNLTDLIYLIFIYEQQTDFPLMFLHHTCTISLIFFSHITNHSHIGALVMIIHDLTDIAVYFIRSRVQTDDSEPIKVCYGISLLIIYFYTRLFVFGKLILACYENQSDWNLMYSTLWRFMCFLYSIHCYWLFLIMKKIFNALFKNEYSDTASLKKQLQ